MTAVESEDADHASEEVEERRLLNRSRTRAFIAGIIADIAYFMLRPFRDSRDLCLKLVRIDYSEVFRRASDNYARWGVLEESVRQGFPAQFDSIKRRYRKAAVREAHWFFEHGRLEARASAKVLACAIAVLGIAWTSLLLIMANPLQFIIVSGLTGLTMFLFILYLAVSHWINVGVVWKIGAVGVILGIGVLLAKYVDARILVADDLVEQVGASLILYGVFVSITAFAAAFAERRTHPLWVSGNPEAMAIVLSLELAENFADRDLGLIGDRLVYTRFSLLRLATCIEQAMGSSYNSVASQRGREAARQIRECSMWLLLQQPGTADAIHDLVKGVGIAFLAGYRHNLPMGSSWEIVKPHPRERVTKLHIVRQVTSALLPISVIIVAIVFSLPMPSSLQQWAVVAAILWFVVKVVLFVDPDFRKTWKEVREILSSRASFSDKQQSVKNDESRSI